MTVLTTNYVMLFSLTTSIVVIMISSGARSACLAGFNARCPGFIVLHKALEAIELENGKDIPENPISRA